MRRAVGRAPARAGVLAAAVGALLLLPAAAASAHPLGNFSVNHYDGLTLFPDRVEDMAVVDTAEIPTLQDRPSVDTDGDGRVSDAERSRWAAAECGRLARDVTLEVAGTTVPWRLAGSELAYLPGAANLATSRLTCRLVATVDLRRAGAVTVRNGFRADRVGWHEITARGSGVSLPQSPVPVGSVSDELRHYPGDLLSSPLGIRSATLRIVPGDGASGPAGRLALPSAGPLTRALSRLDRVFTDLVGSRDLTVWVGTLALLLSLLLGAAHAALPGHGKTVMAAYLAGRRGTRRDALLVGTTVTATHTAGVLVLGLLLTLSSRLAGDAVLADLGVLSGLLVAAIGAGLLRSAVLSALRRRRAAHPRRTADRTATPVLAAAVAAAPGGGTRALAPAAHPDPDPDPDPALGDEDHDHGDHDHGDGHGHGHGDHDHGHGHGHGPHDHGTHRHGSRGGHQHGPGGHQHGRAGRAGLVGMGLAGGLVPSPSALVVLLGAIALGRSAFGVVLVLGYGVGMAATLTAAGLLLVHLRGRLDTALVGGRLVALRRHGGTVAGLLPVLTALLVLVVGLALAVRGLGGVRG